jgi:hypothetical protein
MHIRAEDLGLLLCQPLKATVSSEGIGKNSAAISIDVLFAQAASRGAITSRMTRISSNHPDQ